MKQHLFYISLALLLSACGENSSPPQNIPATPSQPIIEGAPVADTLRPKVEGSCDGNTTISLYVDDQPVTPAVGCDNGVYAIVPDAELTHANHCFSTEATNADGVNSERSERTCAFTGRPFTTVWKTDNGGVTQGNQIRITPVTNAYAYNYSVEWGDGTEDMNLADKAIHTYPAPGVYTVKINGIFPQFDVAIDDSDFGGDYIILTLSDRRKLIAVSQWGSMPWKSMEYAFAMCVNVDFNATDIPDLSNVASMRGMFEDSHSVPQNIGEWNTSNVQNMEEAFAHFYADDVTFDIDISGWDVSKTDNMKFMFFGTGLTTVNYDKLLNSWSRQSVQRSVFFYAGGSKFSSSAVAARTALEADYNWTINDGGMAP